VAIAAFAPNAPLAVSGVPNVCQVGGRNPVEMGSESAIPSARTPRTAGLTDFPSPR